MGDTLVERLQKAHAEAVSRAEAAGRSVETYKRMLAEAEEDVKARYAEADAIFESLRVHRASGHAN